MADDMNHILERVEVMQAEHFAIKLCIGLIPVETECHAHLQLLDSDASPRFDMLAPMQDVHCIDLPDR